MWHITVGRRHYVRQCYLNYSSKRSDLGSPPVAFLTTTQPCKAVPPWRTRKVVIRMKPRRRAPNRNRDLASGEERGEAPTAASSLQRDLRCDPPQREGSRPSSANPAASSSTSRAPPPPLPLSLCTLFFLIPFSSPEPLSPV